MTATRLNDIADFNAHFKINGTGGVFPDHGVIEGNTLHNGTVRDTGNPVTPIDLVAASHWRIRGNRISDFAKAQSDRISYGAFAKGAGADNRFESNVVVCEDRYARFPVNVSGSPSAAAVREGPRVATVAAPPSRSEARSCRISSPTVRTTASTSTAPRSARWRTTR